MHILCSYGFISLKIHILRLHVICSVLHSLFLEDTTTPGVSILIIILATVIPGTVLLLVVIGVAVYKKKKQGQTKVDLLATGEESNLKIRNSVIDVKSKQGSLKASSSRISLKATEASSEEREMIAMSAV